ncbi:glycine cleavage system aminomethyltransferase GcvT [Limisphaera sp. 4302-co]|uniref:glycine cleavage system aminomethyltransferase GcvT n=1 Tax=Limisphaera sp. 4302-co TaxID=3400417 RepID=UPI003C2D12B0
MLRRTPLFEEHRRLGARLVPFAGWELPLQFSSIPEEHIAVRQAVGIFDISHMGEVVASGEAAARFLNFVLTNDVTRLAPGHGQYTLLCNPRGGILDDLYVFRLSEEVFLLVVNAARTESDVQWLRDKAAAFAPPESLMVTDASHNYAAVAIQGPRSAEVMDRCIQAAAVSGARVERPSALRKNQIAGFPFGHEGVLVSRTGYTGEDGFEVLGMDAPIVSLWRAVLEQGRALGLCPCGLGARDTLRLEMGYPLYGQDLDETTTPWEAGLGRFVAMNKGDFIGREALQTQRAQGWSRQSVAFRMLGRTPPPRTGYPIWVDGTAAGRVTSGTQSPSLGVGIGLGYVPTPAAQPGRRIEIEIRGGRHPAEIVERPIYRRPDRPALAA